MRRIFQTVLIMLLLVSCASRRPITITEYRDSLVVHYKVDSVTIHQYDSVFIDRYLKGDTMYITRERWRVEYKDRIREVHDTIRDVQRNTETIEVRHVPPYYKRCAVFLWVIIAVFAVYVGIKIYKRFIL